MKIQKPGNTFSWIVNCLFISNSRLLLVHGMLQFASPGLFAGLLLKVISSNFSVLSYFIVNKNCVSDKIEVRRDATLLSKEVILYSLCISEGSNQQKKSFSSYHKDSEWLQSQTFQYIRLILDTHKFYYSSRFPIILQEKIFMSKA